MNKSLLKFVTDFGPLAIFFFFYYDSGKDLKIAIPPFIVATLVALVSATMTISSSYHKKQFIIDLLQSALATIESEKYKEDGKKLN